MISAFGRPDYRCTDLNSSCRAPSQRSAGERDCRYRSQAQNSRMLLPLIASVASMATSACMVKVGSVASLGFVFFGGHGVVDLCSLWRSWRATLVADTAKGVEVTRARNAMVTSRGGHRSTVLLDLCRVQTAPYPTDANRDTGQVPRD